MITSCELVSEGFDVPAVSGAILLRPTKSLAMSLQQAGRALRLKPDGSKAVILDHVGNVNRFGTPKTDRQWSLDSKKRKAEESGVHACKACFKVFDHDEFISRKESGAGCGEPEDGCIFVAKERDEIEGGGREIEHVAGELTAITESPAWAQGINIARAAGAEFKAMLAKADTLEKLKEIARIRGYHWKWATHIMNQRAVNMRVEIAPKDTKCSRSGCVSAARTIEDGHFYCGNHSPTVTLKKSQANRLYK